MPVKLGKGGEGQEQYNPNDGKYVEDGIPNKSYDNPDENKIINSMGLNYEDFELEVLDDELNDLLGIYNEELDLNVEDDLDNVLSNDLNWLDEESEQEIQIPDNFELKNGILSYSKDGIKKLKNGGFLTIYDIDQIDLEKLIEDNNYLLDPENGTFSRRKDVWGERQNYSYDLKKDENIFSPVQLTIDSNGKYHIVDGNHRVWAMYNSGIKKADFLVSKKSKQNFKNEQLTRSSNLDTNNIKSKQLEIIQKHNPAPNDINTWIRDVNDIKTLGETLEDSDYADYEEYNPDWTRNMAQEAINSGYVTVYSSYPIEQGIFVSPSRMEAQSYAGNGRVYSKKVPVNSIAWIDPTQGQYANTEEAEAMKYFNTGDE